jgi:hypothetical protein
VTNAETRKERDISVEQRKFIEWWATPSKLRAPVRATALAEILGVTDRTLRNWRDRPEIRAARDKLVRARLEDKLPGIIEGLGSKAEAGEAAQVKMALELLGWYVERNETSGTLKIQIEYVDTDDNAETP